MPGPQRDNTLDMLVHLKLLSNSETPAECARTLQITFKDVPAKKKKKMFLQTEIQTVYVVKADYLSM